MPRGYFKSPFLYRRASTTKPRAASFPPPQEMPSAEHQEETAPTQSPSRQIFVVPRISGRESSSTPRPGPISSHVPSRQPHQHPRLCMAPDGSDVLAHPKMAQNIFVNKAFEIKTNAIHFTGFSWVITSLSLLS